MEAAGLSPASRVGCCSYSSQGFVELRAGHEATADERIGAERFLASLDCLHDHAGWGQTEALAIADLAGRVRELAAQAPPPSGLAAIDQVIAAQRSSRDEFAGWLSERAEGPLLYER